MQHITKLIHADPDLVRQIKIAAVMLNITMQQAINTAIKNYLKEVGTHDTNL